MASLHKDKGVEHTDLDSSEPAGLATLELAWDTDHDHVELLLWWQQPFFVQKTRPYTSVCSITDNP
jgi:hypothetical protein